MVKHEHEHANTRNMSERFLFAAYISTPDGDWSQRFSYIILPLLQFGVVKKHAHYTSDVLNAGIPNIVKKIDEHKFEQVRKDRTQESLCFMIQPSQNSHVIQIWKTL